MAQTGQWEWSIAGAAVAPYLETQLDLLRERGLTRLDYAPVRGRAVAALTNAEVEALGMACTAHGVTVATLLSSVGSHEIDTPIEVELRALERTIQIAYLLGARDIRIYTFATPPGIKPANFVGPALQRLKPLVKLAEEADVTLLLENHPGTFSEIPSNIHTLLHAYRDAPVRLAWNPAQFVRAGVRDQVQDFWPLLGRFTTMVTLRDAFLAGGDCAPGDGDGEIARLLLYLQASGQPVRLSLVPQPLVSEAGSGYSAAPGLDYTLHRVRHLAHALGMI